MNYSSTNWRVILISFLEVWRNKTLKFRWKVGENEIWKHPRVFSRVRVSPALAARLPRKLYYGEKGLKSFFREIERKRLFAGRMDGCKVIPDATSTCSMNNFDELCERNFIAIEKSQGTSKTEVRGNKMITERQIEEEKGVLTF